MNFPLQVLLIGISLIFLSFSRVFISSELLDYGHAYLFSRDFGTERIAFLFFIGFLHLGACMHLAYIYFSSITNIFDEITKFWEKIF
jgi:hypothetical protein